MDAKLRQDEDTDGDYIAKPPRWDKTRSALNPVKTPPLTYAVCVCAYGSDLRTHCTRGDNAGGSSGRRRECGSGLEEPALPRLFSQDARETCAGSHLFPLPLSNTS
ncbi:unnamed protein product [Pleuronectes platessa]|uniref:Uncharacterized protein n=1 Tax=Pleuronectes platessa TaxID=8262 RepID=A0A9N7W095_PLEPL|nr:unnamed protein product [Pleuronectes platessa]